MSLWIRPRTRRRAAARGIAMRRNCETSSGRPSSRSTGPRRGPSAPAPCARRSASARDWSRRPVSVKFGFERLFVFEARNATARAFFRGNKQDRRYAVAGAPVEGDVSLPQRREYVARTSLFALKPRCLVEKVRAPFGPLKQCTRSRVGHAAVSASGAIPCS